MNLFMEDILLYHESLTARTTNYIHCSTINIQITVVMNRNPIDTGKLVTSSACIVHAKKAIFEYVLTIMS